jgi:hypothetical protein
VKLDLDDAQGKLISSNFYWRGPEGGTETFLDLNKIAPVTLEAKVEQKAIAGRRVVTVTLHNPTKNIALLAHLQLRHGHSGERVLPVFASDNYVSLAANETRIITLEAAAGDFHGEDAQVVVDGWNVSVVPARAPGVSIAPNVEAQPDHWPITGLRYQTVGLR